MATDTQDKAAGLIHTALNITTQGTPAEVQACSLEDLKINPGLLKDQIVESYISEWKDILAAAKKVKRV